jgi:hypothetical protein
MQSVHFGVPAMWLLRSCIPVVEVRKEGVNQIRTPNCLHVIRADSGSTNTLNGLALFIRFREGVFCVNIRGLGAF